MGLVAVIAAASMIVVRTHSDRSSSAVGSDEQVTLEIANYTACSSGATLASTVDRYTGLAGARQKPKPYVLRLDPSSDATRTMFDNGVAQDAVVFNYVRSTGRLTPENDNAAKILQLMARLCSSQTRR